jgi:hypothetical protein
LDKDEFMAPPKVNPMLHQEAYHLWRDGNGPAAISKSLFKNFSSDGQDVVSERTIAKWVKAFKSLTANEVDSDSNFHWHSMEQHGIPWEAGNYLNNMLYAIHSLNHSNSTADTLQMPRSCYCRDLQLSFRYAKWCWRVHLAAPEIGATVGKLSDVFFIAIQFGDREIFTEILEQPIEIEDLEALLVYKPWLDVGETEERHSAYHRAVEQGTISSFYTASHTFNSHPELLESQQNDLVFEEKQALDSSSTFQANIVNEVNQQGILSNVGNRLWRADLPHIVEKYDSGLRLSDDWENDID